MMTEPGAEHAWLQRMVGSWTYEHRWRMEPGGEPGAGTGREVVRALGDLWVIGEGEGECDGVPMRSVITLGFDEKAAGGEGRFVGSFIASVMGGMFVYEGTRDGGVLTLETSGPSLKDPGKVQRYQDIVELVSDDLRRLRSRALMGDGSWFEHMEGEYRREG